MEQPTASVKNQWNEWSETWYRVKRTEEVIAKLIAKPESAFPPATFEMIKQALPDLRGKRICVPSSGDNHAVFAFHLLGAQVTSCDISENQIANSAQIAEQHGWDIEFVREDTMQLSSIADGEYDLVFTSNGVHVWISDLHGMYRNIHRILKDGGSYVMFDIHPFMRPFGGNEGGVLEVVKPYHLTGPFEDVPRYLWRIQDMANAMLASGLRIGQLEELYADSSFWIDDEDTAPRSQQELDDLGNWQLNPKAALPQWLSILATK
ncbi:class I SAM-dependent methyltransferase [Paenibacillus rhizovicinus]|uniref:Class I SAM-dependent methyltransferase n=1 Tax=Paenibacillus rhizovicinus TaxID=2704463 RepID=A0A6C0NVD1_9BACL|nr:class I SAM-dependent methyltransferase [Paenibacillus rhizovicinus]QHW29886.1 class I SAM-dependent methyltransferase [Paenibacillus rhizovicinus]